MHAHVHIHIRAGLFINDNIFIPSVHFFLHLNIIWWIKNGYKFGVIPPIEKCSPFNPGPLCDLLWSIKCDKSDYKFLRLSIIRLTFPTSIHFGYSFLESPSYTVKKSRILGTINTSQHQQSMGGVILDVSAQLSSWMTTAPADTTWGRRIGRLSLSNPQNHKK